MKIKEYEIKLKDISITPFSNEVPKSVKDVMYLYYTLEITNLYKEKSMSFTAHDFPCVNRLSELLRDIEEVEPVKIWRSEYMICGIVPQFGYEHGMRLEKIKRTDYKCDFTYNLKFYEEFGNCACLSYLSKDEVKKIGEYFDNQVQDVIDNYVPYIDEESE